MGKHEGTNIQVGIALEDFDGRILAGVVDIPVVYARGGYETQSGVADPLPEVDVLVHGARLELLLLLEIEDLQCARLSF